MVEFQQNLHDARSGVLWSLRIASASFGACSLR
jgi:hypothetical protein